MFDRRELILKLAATDLVPLVALDYPWFPTNIPESIVNLIYHTRQIVCCANIINRV